MTKFRPSDHFKSKSEFHRLLPFAFERLDDSRVIVGNAVGDLLILSTTELQRLVELQITPGDGLYERAAEKLLVENEGQQAPRQLLALRLRSRLSFMRAPTPLHIFVVTLRCEHSCPYCQVSRQSSDRNQFDMDRQTATRGIEVAFESPAPLIKIEFQGGEPLLNFELIQFIVEKAKQRAVEVQKDLQFVITTNMALLDDVVLEFCATHQIMLSTSLDGPEHLHNKNRPRPGMDSHKLAVEGIRRAQERLGRDRVGALMTTTKSSLNQVESIIDEYVELGLDGMFLRPLSPYGFAMKTKSFSAYSGDQWRKFYKKGLRYILDKNHSGTHFSEFYATLLLRRMFSDEPTGYVDLRSPAGIALGALVYNYDGKVFASDEGRMLAEMGDRTFEIGDLQEDDYQSLMLSDRVTLPVSESLTQCAPMCSSCAYEPLCGADPVYHHATHGDFVGMKPLSDFCLRQKFLFATLVELLQVPRDAAVLRSWIQ